MDAFVVDWQRRRLLRTGLVEPTHCLHGSRLIEWCGYCQDDLDSLAADLLPKVDTGDAA